MEMSSSCAKLPLSAQPEQTARPLRGPHGGWQKQEIDALRHSIDQATRQGESLRSVFERLGQQLGRKPNSIRNFYYAQIRTQEQESPVRALPFETFAPNEVEQLIKNVLVARAQGMSVRACVRKLADGDHTLMLRYQNKYRSTLRTRPELVRKVMQELSEQGIPFVSPYADDIQPPTPSMKTLHEKAEQTGDPQLVSLLSSLEHLIDLAFAQQNAPDMPTAPGDSEALRRADRLSARCDLLRIALDDEQTRGRELRSETESMVHLLKEYIALPDNQRVDHCDSFCQQAASRLAAVECALMACD